MTSTSYDGAASRLTAAVESFVYRDALGNPISPGGADTSREPRDAHSPKSDNVPRVSQEEIARLISEARTQALAEGARQAAARFEPEVAQERERVAEALSEFQQQREQYYSKVEIELVHLALAIAAKILHRESQVDRTVVAGLVKVMLEKLQQNTQVVVRVRPEEAESWRRYFHDHEGLQVVEDSALAPKGCVLQTDLGSADVGLDAQLKEVEQGFFDLLAQRPEAK